MPRKLRDMVLYILELGFEETPDYNFINTTLDNYLDDLFTEYKLNRQNYSFEWVKKTNVNLNRSNDIYSSEHP